MASPDLTIVKKKLYVGCGLTDVPQEFTDNVERVKDLLQTEWDVMQFLGTTAGTARDVYITDILRNVDGCDAFVGVADERSTGLGFETCRAMDRHKPTLIVAHVNAKITRLLLGAAEVEPNVTFRQYCEFEEIPAIVNEEFAAIRGLTQVTGENAITRPDA